MDRWSKLSMKERSDLIKLYIDNGIYSLEEIKKDYNKFDDRWDTKEYKVIPDELLEGYYNNQFGDGGFTDWLKRAKEKANSYLTSSRLGKFLAGFDQMMKGGQQTQNNSNTNSNSRSESALLSRIRPNDSRTREESEAIEDDIAKRQISMIREADRKGHPSEAYAIPYIMEQEIKIPGVGRTTKNMLDSIAVNAVKAGIPLYEAIGLAAEETALGAAPNVSTDAWVKNFKKENNRMPTDKEIHERENKVMNSSYARNYGQIYPQFLINDHEWHKRGWEESPKYREELEGIQSPLQHGFTLYKMGLYNTGDKNHTRKVRSKGKSILDTEVIKDWVGSSKYAQSALKVK